MKRLMSMESLRKRQHGHSASIHSNHSSSSLVGAPNISIRQSPPTTYQNDKYMIPVIDVRPGAEDYSHSQDLAGDELLVRRLDDNQTVPKPRGHKSRPLPVPNSQSPTANPTGTAINPFHISLSVSRKRRPLPQPNQMGNSPYSSSASSHAHSHSGSSNMTNNSHIHGAHTAYFDSSSLHVPRSSPAHTTTFSQVRKNPQYGIVDEHGRTNGLETTSPPLLPPLDFGSTGSLFNGHTPRFSILFPPNLLESRVLPDVPSSAPPAHMMFNVPPPPSHPPPVIPPRSEARKRTPSPLRTRTNLTTTQQAYLQPAAAAAIRDTRVDSLIAPPLNFDPRHASVLYSPTPGKVNLTVPESVQHRFGSSFVPVSPLPTEPARPLPTPSASPVNVRSSTLAVPPLTTPSSGHPSTPSSYTAVTDTRHSGATKAEKERESRSRERPALTVRTWDLGKSGKDKPVEPVEHVPVPNYPAAPMYIKDEVAVEKERAQTLFVQNRSALDSATTLSRTTSARSGAISRANTANVKPQVPTQPLAVSQPKYRAGETIMPELEDSGMLSESARFATEARRKTSGEIDRGRPARRQLPIPPTAIPSTLPQPSLNAQSIQPSNPTPTSANKGTTQAKEKTQVSDVVMVQLKKMRMGRRKSRSISGWSSINPFSSSNTSLSSNASAGGAFPSLRRDRNNGQQHESRPSFSSGFASFGKRPANPYYDHGRQPHSASSSRSSFSNLSLSYITSKIRSRSQSSARDPYDFSNVPQRAMGGSAVIFANSSMGDASRGSVWEQIAASSSNVNLPLHSETTGKGREEDVIARWQEGTPMEQTFHYAPPPPALVPLGESNRSAKPVSALWTRLRTTKADR